MKKLILLNLLFISFMSCSIDKNEQDFQNENVLDNQAYSVDTEKFLGVAYVGIDETRIDIGEKYNLVHSSKFEPIRFLKTDFDFEIEEISETEYILYPQTNTEVIIHIKDAIIESDNLTFSYKVQSEQFSHEIFQPGEITIFEPETQSWWPIVREIVKEIAKNVIVDKVSEELTDLGDDEESCTDQAIRACGEGGVSSVDEGGWFSGCSYSCK